MGLIWYSNLEVVRPSFIFNLYQVRSRVACGGLGISICHWNLWLEEGVFVQSDRMGNIWFCKVGGSVDLVIFFKGPSLAPICLSGFFHPQANLRYVPLVPKRFPNFLFAIGKLIHGS